LAPTDSSSERETIHVRLLDENVPVWRPVLATRLNDNLYLIEAQEIPEYEEWEFLPGSSVETEEAMSDGTKYNRAFRLGSQSA
jgi:hypothetical protein